MTVVALNKMIIEVNNRVTQAVNTGNIASQSRTVTERTATAVLPNELDELLKMTHNAPVWARKRNHREGIGKDDGPNNKKRIKELEDDVARIIQLMKHVLHKEDAKAIDIDGTSSGGEGDVDIWVEKNLPPTIPLGYFVDIYSFLDIILAANNGIGSLGNLVTDSRLEIGSDEAVAIAGFLQELPILFGKSSAANASTVKTLGKSFDLPALTLYTHCAYKSTGKDSK